MYVMRTFILAGMRGGSNGTPPSWVLLPACVALSAGGAAGGARVLALLGRETLPAGASCRLRARAANALGFGPWSEHLRFAMGEAVPGAPSGLALVEASAKTNTRTKTHPPRSAKTNTPTKTHTPLAQTGAWRAVGPGAGGGECPKQTVVSQEGASPH